MGKSLFYRELLEDLKKWSDRKEIFAIKGPRQSGKTTLTKMYAEWLYKQGIERKQVKQITFEDMEILEKFNKSPKEFMESLIEDKKTKHFVFFDEYHYVKDGGKKLKLLYDTIENVKFVVTGSSSLEITKFSKYLVGRVFSFNLLPFSFYEFLSAKEQRIARIYKEKNDAVRQFLFKGKGFKTGEDIFVKDVLKYFDDFIVYGGYPEIVKAKDKKTKEIIIKNIYETYITKDIIELLRIHDITKFRKLVSVLASQTGGIVNYNEIAIICNSYYKEVIELLSAMEETYVIKLVRPFHKNVRTELRKNPKVYFIDAGLRNYSINNFGGPENRPDKGNLAENFVFTQLFNITKDFNKINYWRTLSKAEVDFTVSAGTETIPIEVKFSAMRKPSVSRSFRSFISAYNPSRGIVFTKNFWGKTKIGKTEIKFIPICYL